jgi:deoxyadenosine/deoxycytidine kinase
MYFIEGNIGAGKSTLVSALAERGLNTLQEPVDSWTATRNSNGKNLLQEFYEDPKRWAYTFQSMAFRTRVMSMDTIDDDCIVERSVYTDRMVFAEAAKDDGNIDMIEWNDYINWFDFIMDKLGKKPNGIIYLRGSPETCMKHIKQRGREGEENISLDYLKVLHKKHDIWLSNESNVLVLDIDTMDRSTFVDEVIRYLTE